ncbi:MAG: ATP-binding protein [uncultured Sulfurovum sp.]|uniref:ATP-binding protein n=1 Tax=uncultured Sulfurovum sp. TaxID=269237 RepID=A0A6S6SNP9_9BACT|nr:MAG: ATP-binding protein [uncultured Sulfurovum sp.]
MQNLLILYNPYYNQEMIEDHIRILNKSENPNNAKVAFGKIRSKMRDYDNSGQEVLDTIFRSINSKNPMQLFLTDFSSMYVCYVEKVSIELNGVKAPEYYENLDVESWFIISDMREIIRNNFEYVREQVLVQFTTPTYKNHTYRLYGNRYDYPLVVEQKNPINYFENFLEGERNFAKVFKSNKYSLIQQDLMHYIFGKKLLYSMHPDSLESLVTAEVQYAEHKENATYDFSTVVILYSKVFENESYYFLKELFKQLMIYDCDLENIEYQVQGHKYTLYDYLTQKPNIGTNKYLIGNPKIFTAYKEFYHDYRKYSKLLNLLRFELKNAITNIQKIRNAAAHGGSTSKQDCEAVRSIILGVGEIGIISSILTEHKLIL